MKAVHALLLAAVALLLWFNLYLKPSNEIIGDGFEYVMMSESFLRHGDPELTAQDYAFAATLKDKIDNIFAMLPPHNETGPYGYLRSRDGRFYSYHFWLYPLVNVPALALTNALDWPPTYSFIITNSVALLLALVTILLCAWLTDAQKIIIGAGALFCGTTFYLNWNHPEVFTFLATLVGCVCLYGRRHKSAAALFALVAQQNPPVGLLCVAALSLEAWSIVQAPADRIAALRRLAQCALIGALLLSSPLFYYYHFGVANLIQARGAARTALISLERVSAVFLDLDQGMIVGVPFLLLLLIVCILARMRSAAGAATLVALAVSPVAFATLSASTNNWNSEHAVFMRYAFWACAPWIVLLAALFEGPLTRFRLVALTTFVVGQVTVVAAFGVLGAGQGSRVRTKASAFALDHFPRLYNPIPDTFIDRGNGPVGAGNVYAWTRGKSAVKILFNDRATDAGTALGLICTAVRPLDKHEIRRSEGGWWYINQDDGCPTLKERGLSFAPAPQRTAR